MAIQPPTITTYHCICTSLLLASTHTLSSLPRRQSPPSSSPSDSSIILPLPSSPPPELTPETTQDLPAEGYSMLLGLHKDPKITIVRREDGFEKRVLYRCARCRVVVGYEVVNEPASGRAEKMDVDGDGGKEKEMEKEGYSGKVIYVLPGGVVSTDFMARGRKIEEGAVAIGKGGGVGVFE